ncbi:MAG: hypothetical protein HQ532_02850 [Candidatus Omnitrophica bacterium]|nr:hypothetical protein [Candidatus Omnitrophota bacterium]
MKKIFLILLLVYLVHSIPAYCENVEVNSEVISVNSEFEFFVIAAGEEKGIEIGDGFIVHREGEKIAAAYIIEVRPDVSAAEVLELEDNQEISEGDEVLLVKRKATEQREVPQAIKPRTRDISRAQIIQDRNAISTAIARDPKSVLFYASLVLRENGYSIISSNRATGTLLATKPINLTLFKELWADAVAEIGHNLVVSIDIKKVTGRSELTASSFKEHFRKNDYIKRGVEKNSKYYKEITELVYKIKERSEH